MRRPLAWALVATLMMAPSVISTSLVQSADAAARPKAKVVDASAREDDGPAKVRIKLAAVAKSAVKVQWSTKDGSAKAGSDYARSSGTATIKRGKKSVVVKVKVIDDSIVEETEAFTVIISSARATVTRKKATVTIFDDDGTTPGDEPQGITRLSGSLAVRSHHTSVGSTVVTEDYDVALTWRPVKEPATGYWFDDGTGSWTLSGTRTENRNPPDPGDECDNKISSTAFTGSGRLTTSDQVPSPVPASTGTAAIRGKAPYGQDLADAQAWLDLQWFAITFQRTTWRFNIDTLVCESTITTGTARWRPEYRRLPLGTVGPAFTVTGAGPATRGLSIDYTESADSADPGGYVQHWDLMITGSLTP